MVGGDGTQDGDEEEEDAAARADELSVASSSGSLRREVRRV